jgi:hypothetical protein
MDWTPLSTAAVAATVALLGYALNQHAVRRASRAKFFAESLLAIKEFEELPYRIAKRADSSPKTRQDFGNRVNDAYEKMSFYQSWLRIETPAVGMAYDMLVFRSERIGIHQQEKAWSMPVLQSDDQMYSGIVFFYGSAQELELCEKLMQNELRVLPILRRRNLKAQLAQHRKAREAAGESVNEFTEGLDF